MDNLQSVEPLGVLMKVALFFAAVFLLGLTLQKVFVFLRVLYVLYGLFPDRPTAIIRVFKVAIRPDKAWENVIGDLLEEYSQFPSKLDANLWLQKQLLESLPYLLLKAVKNRLASYFRERVR